MASTEIALLDLLIVGTASVSVLIGAVRGFVREAFSLAVWVAAFVVANLAAREASDLFARWVEDETLRRPFAFGSGFLVTLILGNLATRLFGLLVDATGLTGLDRTLGTLFGAVRALVLLVVIAAFTTPLFADAQWWQASQLVPHLVAAQAETFEIFDRLAALIRTWIDES